MARLLRQLFAICLLRAGPQELPYSLRLTRGLVLASIGMDVLAAWLLGVGQGLLPRLALSLALLLGAPWLLLKWRQRSNRYLQTLAALVGTGLLLTVVALPLAMLVQSYPPPDSGQMLSPAQIGVAWLTLLLLGWKVLINAHIFRHSLDVPMAGGALVAVGLLVIELGLARALVGM
ncbi:MAG TPA: hypothetical protein VFG21_01195 [Xanthomonadaceae bacterium]|nr:hypothetical protein [Xanthomonadaceae bacterium]